MYENNKFGSYRKDQQSNEYWRCTINGCIARLKTSNGSELVELIINNHSHSDTVANETIWTFLTRFYTVFSCVFIHFCRAFLYITKMRFHHQLMRYHKTALATIDMGRKFVAGGYCAPFRWGELCPHVTQSGLGQGLPPYQVVS